MTEVTADFSEKKINSSELTNRTAPSRNEVWRMFDRISPSYDLLNLLLSFQQDRRWRKKLATYLPPGDNLEILDLATGTGDLILSLFKHCNRIKSGVGLDMAGKMLAIGQKKINQAGLKDKATLVRGDAVNLPFDDQSFSAVTISFGIRNVLDVNKALSEMNRILQPGGRALILEFSLPDNRLIRSLYLFYFRYILPLVGSIVSGDSYAYRYLNQTVETFPYGSAFGQLMSQAGFKKIEIVPLTFGVATIYCGVKE